MSQFEKFCTTQTDPYAVSLMRQAWNACVAEAERLCLAQYGSSVERYRAACKDCAAQIAKLAEVDRG